MEPWGTLDITESRGEETPFNNTSWQRLDRQLEIQQMNKWDWNLEAKKSVQESLVQDTVESLSKLEKHTGSTLAIFQNLMPLMYSQEEGGHSRLVSSKSKLIIGQHVLRRQVFQQKVFNVTLQTLADDRHKEIGR